MLITTKNIEKVFNTGAVEFKALRGIDLEIEAGEFTVIAGPSGSGKTTLLNIIGTLDAPTEGSLTFKGQEISNLSESEKSDLRLNHIGFVFQAYNLINVLSAAENVEYILHLQGAKKATKRARALELLEHVGLVGLEDRRPNELSGGQQQRVAVARALASNPELVLADEPTANLDQTSGNELMELLVKLNKEEGRTFVISSHDPMVIGHAKRVLHILDGRIVKDERRD
jgi:putative ABC transport system ATP-binding protein